MAKPLKLAVTGHRPDKLGGYSDRVFSKLVQLATEELSKFDPAPVIVYTGMALGWDQAVAQACISLEIPFFAAIPFKGQESRWPKQAQEKYQELLDHAADLKYLYKPPGMIFMFAERNEYMVDKCNHLLALFNGTKGGTFITYGYAREQGVEITNCWKRWLEMNL
jgi:uncharacterized phage-like protein YoqJ